MSGASKYDVILIVRYCLRSDVEYSSQVEMLAVWLLNASWLRRCGVYVSP
jgi:hypothetical protein